MSDDDDESNRSEGDLRVEEPNEDQEDGTEPVGKRKRKRKRKKKDPTSSSVTHENGESKEDVNKLDSLDHTVYVEGIPFNCTDQEVKDFFVQNGIDDIIQMRLPTWQDSGRLRGYGHIVFNTIESRKRAIECSGKNLQKRYLTIQAPKVARTNIPQEAREQPEGCNKVFVKNLPYDITEEDVENTFRSCGKILQGGVRLARNYQTKQCKGFGYVEFKNPEGAYAAVQRSSRGTLVMNGRACFVDYDEGTMKGSFRDEKGKLWSKEHGDKNKRFRRS
jgi:nucleolin